MRQPRRDFAMPERDREFLDDAWPEWETVVDAGHRWLIVHHFPIPPQYNLRQTSAALMIDPKYPDAQLDMVYFKDALCLPGKSIRNLSLTQIVGEQWQRWSRHRTEANPWVAGEDCVETQFHLVCEWLEREIAK